VNVRNECAAEPELAPPRTWKSALVWPTLALAGWIAFELTAQPAVVMPVVCSRFGWGDFLTALWLWRRDPCRRRARACACFLLALGVTRIVVSAFGMALVIICAIAYLEPQQFQNPNDDDLMIFLAPLTGSFGGIPILSILALMGCITARRHQVRVWIDANLNRARKANCWPPVFNDLASANLQNSARAPWLFTIAFAVVMAGTFGIFAYVHASSVIVGGLVFIGPLVVLAKWSRDLFAASPGECWGAGRHAAS